MKYIIFVMLLMGIAQAEAEELKNVDNLIDSIYEKAGENILNKIFISKDSLKNTLIQIDKSDNIDLINITTPEELNDKLQKKFLRKQGVERRDLKSNKFNFDINKIFVQKNNVNNIPANKIWLVAGATYETMNTVFKKISSNKNYKNSQYIMLVSDRPIVLEDFKGNIINQIYNALVAKTPKFNKHKNEVKKIIEQSLADNSFPALKKMILYTKLVSLINTKLGRDGEQALENLKKSIKTNGLQSEITKNAIVECRKFIYTKATILLPTEKDLANMIVKKYDISNVYISYTKTKYQTQDRATTMDTYYDFLKYIDANNISINSLVFINIEPYSYRQWWQIASLCKAQKLCQNNIYPDFIVAKEDKISDNIFKDEFARLIYAITKESYSNFLPK